MPAYYKGYLRAIQLHISNCYPFESILPAQTESELFWADFSIDLVLLSILLNREEFIQKQTQMLHCFSGKIIKFRPPDWLHLWCELPVASCRLPATGIAQSRSQAPIWPSRCSRTAADCCFPWAASDAPRWCYMEAVRHLSGLWQWQWHCSSPAFPSSPLHFG